jgi:hypothetical protein
MIAYIISHHLLRVRLYKEAMCPQNVLVVEAKSQDRSVSELSSVKCRICPQEKVTLTSGPLSSATKQEYDRRVFMAISVSAFQKSGASTKL